MSDLEFIKKIEKQIECPLKQIDIQEFNRNFWKYETAYSINQSGKVISLSICDKKVTDFFLFEQFYELETLAIIRSNIEDCNFLQFLPKLNKLNLSGNYLTNISVLSKLKGLTELNLNRNKLTDISVLSELKELTDLNLGRNKVTDISVLSELKELTDLNISRNKVTDISVLNELKELTRLNISNNNLTNISALSKLKGLTKLNLARNHLTNISFLSELNNLTILFLPNNSLTDITVLRNFKKLIGLYIWNNKLTDVSVLSELKELTELSLGNNNLKDISFIKDLPMLKLIDVDENPDIKEPDNIIISQGAAAIRRYFLQKEKAGTDFLYEAKVLFVGEPGAGKTSLMEKLIDPSYKVNPKKPVQSTLGIDIKKWPFNLPGKPDIKFKAHFWDFGGQNIQYYIHQFFLTERSVYILLVDDRKDNSNVDYWFNIIKLLGKGSPVLLVCNEKEIDSSTNFDNIKYENRYKDFFKIIYCKVDLKKDDGRFEVIKNKLKELLCNLEHVGNPMLTGWIKIREELEKQQHRNYIPFSEFKKICKSYNITGEENQLVLCNYLHDLGILLHYRNESGLADTVFLNPHWITKAVYTILDEKHLEETKGSFTKEWLFKKWKNSYKFEEMNKILLLMQKEEFDICYRLKNAATESYLFPQLLNDVTPKQANDWQRKGSLSFRYRYPFMPKGIITRITVRLCEWIKSENNIDLVWRSGVILVKDDCRALIKEDISYEGLKVIDISVTGDVRTRKELLAHIRCSMDALHNIEDNKIEHEKLIPCCCENCLESDNPGYFELSRLHNYVNAGKYKITCEKVIPFTEVEIEELLEGVVQKPIRLNHRFENWKEEFQIDKTKDEIQQLLMKMERGPTNINFGDVSIVNKSPKSKISTNKSKNKSTKGAFKRIAAIVAFLSAIVGIIAGIHYLFYQTKPSDFNQKVGLKQSKEKPKITNTNQSIIREVKQNSTNQLSGSKIK